MRSTPNPALLAIPLSVLLLASTARAEADPSLEEVKAAMAKATRYVMEISEPARGGYLWRYSLDLSVVAGEELATRSSLWVQPPGTPAMGEAFLDAYEASGDPLHLEAAKRAADALAWCQLASGGWPAGVDFAPEALARLDLHLAGGTAAGEGGGGGSLQNRSTLDDDTTQSALRFLMRTLDHPAPLSDGEPAPGREERIAAAVEHGLAGLLEAQYPVGAWPQRFDGRAHDPDPGATQRRAGIPQDWPRERPEGHRYDRFYTLNDGALQNCIATLLEAHRRFGREEYLAAAERGGDFLLRAQLPEPQPVWAPQYNLEMQPDWARAFEPPAVSSGESVSAMQALLELHLATGDERYLAPLPAALAWFERSALGPERWARFYELGSNRAIYGDRDGKIYYRLEEISEERRRGYAWEGGFGLESFRRRYDERLERGRERVLASRQPRERPEAERVARRLSRAAATRETLDALDEQGRWVSGGSVSVGGTRMVERVETSVFIRQMRVLSEYLRG